MNLENFTSRYIVGQTKDGINVSLVAKIANACV